jgi:hypothetical protein
MAGVCINAGRCWSTMVKQTDNHILPKLLEMFEQYRHLLARMASARVHGQNRGAFFFAGGCFPDQGKSERYRMPGCMGADTGGA